MNDKNKFAYKRNRNELESALSQQLGFLRRSSDAYDNGFREEALRLATVVYTLVHDGGKSKSLLRQLKILPELELPDSSDDLIKLDHEQMEKAARGRGTLKRAGLPLCSVSLDGEYHPKLDKFKLPNRDFPYLKFSKWWNQDIYSTPPKLTLTRSRLVKALRSQDGGSHYDPNRTDREHHSLAEVGDPNIIKNGEFVGAHFSLSSTEESELLPGDTNISGAHWASMRQIAWEVEQAISRICL